MTIPTPRTLDSLDGRIILALDKDPEASALALSRTLGVARNTVHARLARLERSGALRSFSRIRLFGLQTFPGMARKAPRRSTAHWHRA
ncbi:putative transcriptional regulator [Arthrobacter sp. UYNi723]